MHFQNFLVKFQILIDPVTKVSYGVEYVREGKVHVAKATKEVILSAGAVGTPQLLMLSGDLQKTASKLINLMNSYLIKFYLFFVNIF